MTNIIINEKSNMAFSPKTASTHKYVFTMQRKQDRQTERQEET